MGSGVRILAAAIGLCSLSKAALAQDAYRPETGTLLQVEAVGSIKKAPDVMSVSAGVVTTGTTAAEALERNNELAGRLIEAIKGSGIRISQLQTLNLSVSARFAENREREIEGRPPQVVGYAARNTLEVEFGEVAQAGNLIGLMFEAGANEVQGPYFFLRDPAAAERRAEQSAIAQARAEAENYAEALGMKVARVLRVSDRNFQDRIGASSIVVTGSRISSTPIEPGEITRSATVYMEFLLEPQ